MLNPVEIFRQDVPWDFLKLIAAAIRDAYPNADTHVKKRFSMKVIQDNARPTDRRQLIEQEFYDTASEYGNGVVVSQVKAGTFWHHVEVKSSRVLLTIARSSDEEASLRPSDWKSVQANKSQKFLFPEYQEGIGEQCLFATIVHGNLKNEPSQIGFVIVKFPKNNSEQQLDGFHPGEIDLMDEFQELFTIQESIVEDIPDTAFPVLRRNKNTRQG